MNNKVAIGEVVSPSGFKGQFKIKSFTEKKDNFFKYGPVSIGSKFTGIRITKIKNAKDMFVVRCENIATKEAVEEIRGALIFVDREILPNLDSNKTFYFHDLINMKVYNENNNFLGKVISVDNYGSDDVIEIKDDNNVTILISLNEKFINQIKLSENKILVKNIEGYFDEKNI